MHLIKRYTKKIDYWRLPPPIYEKVKVTETKGEVCPLDESWVRREIVKI